MCMRGTIERKKRMVDSRTESDASDIEMNENDSFAEENYFLMLFIEN